MRRRGDRGRREHTLRIGVFGLFGMGNLGNEGSLTAFVEQVHAVAPDASFICFGADADAAEREHNIPAFQLMTYRAPANASGWAVLALKCLSRLWDIPRIMWLVGKVDVLVVPGMGVLESRLTSRAWGLPYWLFLAVAACRLRGRPVALVSVGAEPVGNRAMRVFMSRIIKFADYVSYRDAASVAVARSIGSAGVPGSVYPDLAFSLPAPAGIAVRPGHVVVGVMAFAGGTDDPVQGPAVVERYVDRMVELLDRLCDRGHSITLLVGDTADLVIADRIRQRLPVRDLGVSDPVAIARDAEDLDAIMREMARAEAVVVSRFHNLVCALKVLKPVVSLGYAQKNRDLLAEFGLPDWTHDMTDFDVDRAVAEAEEAAARRLEFEPVIRAALESHSASLEDQMAELSRTILESRSSRSEPAVNLR